MSGSPAAHPTPPESCLACGAQEQRAQEGSLSDLFAGLRDPSASWEWKRWRMAKWVESDVAKGTGAVLVCLNALTIGGDLTHGMHHPFP